MAWKIPSCYYTFLILFDPKLPDNKGYDRCIEMLGPEDKFRMGPIYPLSQEDKTLLIKYLDTMIRERKIRPSSSTVGSPSLFVPKPNGPGLCLCIDYRHLNDYRKKDHTPLLRMGELQSRHNRSTHVTTVDLKPGLYLIRMALGNKLITAFRTMFGL